MTSFSGGLFVGLLADGWIDRAGIRGVETLMPSCRALDLRYRGSRIQEVKKYSLNNYITDFTSRPGPNPWTLHFTSHHLALESANAKDQIGILSQMFPDRENSFVLLYERQIGR